MRSVAFGLAALTLSACAGTKMPDTQPPARDAAAGISLSGYATFGYVKGR